MARAGRCPRFGRRWREPTGKPGRHKEWHRWSNRWLAFPRPPREAMALNQILRPLGSNQISAQRAYAELSPTSGRRLGWSRLGWTRAPPVTTIDPEKSAVYRTRN